MNDNLWAAPSRAVDSVESPARAFRAEETADRLRPSLEEQRDYQTTQNPQDRAIDICGPDFELDMATGRLEPTPKRELYTEQAYEAINTPDSAEAKDAPLSPAEQEKADSIAKIIGTNSVSTGDPMQSHDEQKALVDEFAEIPQEALPRIMAEVNEQVEGTGRRVAQAESGEVWLGRKDENSDRYLLRSMVREAPATCMMS